jgi:hypothetical protein
VISPWESLWKLNRSANLLWTLIRGFASWSIWIDRNGNFFQQDVWASQKLEIMLWDALIDHGRKA